MRNVLFMIKIKVKEEYSDEVYTFMKAIHKLTHEFDEGIIQYDLHKVKDEENTFCFIENWESNEAYEIHRNKEHTKNFKDYLEDKIVDVQKIFLEKYEDDITATDLESSFLSSLED